MIPVAPILYRRVAVSLLPQPFRKMWQDAVVIQTFPNVMNKFLYRPASHLVPCHHDGGGTSGYRVTDIGPALYHDSSAVSRFQSDPLFFLDGETAWPPFTMALLIKREGGEQNKRFVRGGNAGNLDWILAEATGGFIRWYSANTSGGTETLDTPDGYPSDTWITIVATWDGTTKRLYRDALLKASSTPSNLRCRTDGTNVLIFVEGTTGFTGYYGIMVLGKGAWAQPEIDAFAHDPWGFFRPYGYDRLFAEEFSYLLPTSTVAAGGWTATGAGTLHEAIDEVPVNDSDYIEYSPPDPDPDTVKFGLTNISTGVGEGDVTFVVRTEATEL